MKNLKHEATRVSCLLLLRAPAPKYSELLYAVYTLQLRRLRLMAKLLNSYWLR